MVLDLLSFEDLEEKDRWLNQSMSFGGDCRTASAQHFGDLLIQWNILDVLFAPLLIEISPFAYILGKEKKLTKRLSKNPKVKKTWKKKIKMQKQFLFL